MGKRIYTEEQNAFLKRHPILDRVILTALFNREFNESKSVEAIRNHCRRGLGMKMVNTTTFAKSPDKMKRWKKGECSEGAKKSWFKKGCKINAHDVGTEHIKGGFVFIKYTDKHKKSSKNFAPKHRVIWRKYHGEIGRDDVITFKDGNRLNCNIENLELIPRGLFMTLAKIGYTTENPELKPTIKALTELEIAARKRRKK